MRALLLAVLLLGPAAAADAARAAGVVAVAPPAAAGPYREALSGLCAALGACPRVLAPGDDLPGGTRVVVALGGRAARADYPPSVTLVTALTPGFEARRDGDGPVVRVRLTPSPKEFARRLLAQTPKVRRAILLWADPVSGRFTAAARAAGAALGLDLVPQEVSDPDDLPARLRALPGADGLWLAPDPGLVTPVTFDAVREYARSRGEVFFAPAPGLAARGADAGLAPSFRASGERAGKAALDLLQGETEPQTAYPAADDDGAEAAPLLSTRTSVSP